MNNKNRLKQGIPGQGKVNQFGGAYDARILSDSDM